MSLLSTNQQNLVHKFTFGAAELSLSDHDWIVWPFPIAQMPALATTMSSRLDNRGVDLHTFLLRQPRRLIEILGPRERIGVALQVGTDVQRDDAGALGGEIDCVGTALAARGARYDCDLVVQLSH